MTAVVARRYGGSDELSVADVPTPSPSTEELLVRVEASSVNPLDWHFLTGTPYFIRLMAGLRRPKRTVHGADVAGTVVAVGSAVTGFEIGDRVYGETEGGGFGPYLCAKPGRVVPLPAGVDTVAAGATPVAGLTALQALRTHGRVSPGDRVLINGGSGGVGTFAVQIARALGADEVTAVCSTTKVELVRALGATRVVDYLNEDFAALDRQFDVIVDNVGNRRAAEYRSLLVPGGRYVAVSGPKANRWLGPVPWLLGTRLRFVGADQTFHQFTASPNHDDLTFLGELLAAGTVVPTIDRVVGLDGVAEAIDEVAAGHTRAKIVVNPQNRTGEAGQRQPVE